MRQELKHTDNQQQQAKQQKSGNKDKRSSHHSWLKQQASQESKSATVNTNKIGGDNSSSRNGAREGLNRHHGAMEINLLEVESWNLEQRGQSCPVSPVVPPLPPPPPSPPKEIKQEKREVTDQQKSQVHLDENDHNLSFCGCGFLGIYHVGVASCFHQYAPQLSMHKIAGSSAGALVAAAHICGNLQLACATTDILRVAIDARARALGPFHPSFNINTTVREALERGLPDDVHVRASGKLHISLTRAYDSANVIVSQFDSKEEVIQALLCSCFIPLWSGLSAPKFRGTTYIDGGFSNNQLILDNKTVTVSPFAGEADICPQDDNMNLLQVSLSNTSFSISPNNLYRLSHALLPPPPEVLSDLCEQGFVDGIRFLQKMKLISCTRCLEIRSSLLVTTTSEDTDETFSHQQVHRLNRKKSTSSQSISHIRLEQQKQKIIEIDDHGMVKRRNSVSTTTTSRIYQQHHLNADNCNECVEMRQQAIYESLPTQFSERIRDACDAVNQSLSTWIYSYRPIKYLSYLAFTPVDISLALVQRCWQELPLIRSELINCMCSIVKFLLSLIRQIYSRSTTSILMEQAPVSDLYGYAIEFEKEIICYCRASRSCDNSKDCLLCLDQSSNDIFKLSESNCNTSKQLSRAIDCQK